jgi:Gluconate 2-dehydrogenase subunit 3
LIPPDDQGAPGAKAAGAADYIDGLLGAFLVDPPRIWAGGPFSGRHGGEAGFERFLPLGAVEELAWRTRIEGSQGQPEREFNGPVIGLQERYTAGLAGLGGDFTAVEGAEQDARLAADPAFQRLLYEHACEGTYGDPAYGGNRDRAGWVSVRFVGDTQPRGWTDDEVVTGG